MNQDETIERRSDAMVITKPLPRGVDPAVVKISHWVDTRNGMIHVVGSQSTSKKSKTLTSSASASFEYAYPIPLEIDEPNIATEIRNRKIVITLPVSPPKKSPSRKRSPPPSRKSPPRKRSPPKSRGGCSNAARHAKEGLAPSEFCGPAGGSCATSFPVNTPSRRRAALMHAHFAPNPEGIRQCVRRYELRSRANKSV